MTRPCGSRVYRFSSRSELPLHSYHESFQWTFRNCYAVRWLHIPALLQSDGSEAVHPSVLLSVTLLPGKGGTRPCRIPPAGPPKTRQGLYVPRWTHSNPRPQTVFVEDWLKEQFAYRPSQCRNLLRTSSVLGGSCCLYGGQRFTLRHNLFVVVFGFILHVPFALISILLNTRTNHNHEIYIDI